MPLVFLDGSNGYTQCDDDDTLCERAQGRGRGMPDVPLGRLKLARGVVVDGAARGSSYSSAERVESSKVERVNIRERLDRTAKPQR
jgi:hypothetical protein